MVLPVDGAELSKFGDAKENGETIVSYTQALAVTRC
jgi:hypothetical protein